MVDSVTDIPIVEKLAKEILEKRKTELGKKIQRFSRNQPILSDLGECDRQITYGVLDWDKRELHNEELQARFEVGNLWEREIIHELERLGYGVILSQQPVEIRNKNNDVIARGKIDGFIYHSNQKIPIEIKTMNVNVFNQINSIEDFEKKPWLRKYIRQLQLYMYGNNVEYSLFILTDCLGSIKIFPLYLDYGLCEWLLQRLERIHTHLQAKTYPDRIEYKEDVCGKCPFVLTCLPDAIRNEAKILTDDELLIILDERENLRESKSRYEELDKLAKKQLEGIEKGIAGNYMIIGKMKHREGFTVEPSDFWETKIKFLGENK